MIWFRSTAAVLIVAAIGAVMAGDEAAQSAPDRDAVKAALARFNPLIGGWRGIGQPKRNSNRGAWPEKAQWTWSFMDDDVALDYTVDKGKLIRNARLTFDPERESYRFLISYADGEKRSFDGTFEDNRLVLNSPPDNGYVYRTTIKLLNEKRTLVLLERRKESQSFYSRIAEVGYTREGTSLAVTGAGETECIVTGGKGTMAVAYKGKTYYVCCTGCRQAFEDDPEGIIAEYKERLAKRRKK